MPMYNIEHSCPLTEQQKDQLAEAITKIHTDKFTVPRFFVNVSIKDISSEQTYGGGVRNEANRISGNIRHGPSRSDDMLREVVTEIGATWASIVGTKGDQELRAVLLLGSIVASAEKGFLSSKAGTDVDFLKKNYAAFKKKADEGDKEFQDLMQEIETREVFRGVVNGETGTS